MKMIDVKAVLDKLELSPYTKSFYAEKLGLFLLWSGGREPTPELAQEYINSLRGEKKPNTIAVAANALKAYFKAQEQTVFLRAPTVQMGEPKYHSLDDIESLLSHCKSSLEACLVTVIFETGCRIMEIGNLKLRDIDWERGFLHVTRKGGYEADVIIFASGLKALKGWLEERQSRSERVFMDHNYNSLYTILKKLAKRAGVDNFTPHHLRHSRAVQMEDAGCSIQEIQRFLGHKTIATTINIYGQRRPVDLKVSLEQKSKVPDWRKER